MRKINFIIIHHSVSPRDQDGQKSVSSFSNSHKARLHPDPNGFGLHIAYHYVIDGEGKIWDTRPLDEIGYHASNWEVNKASIGICLTGNFDKEDPSEAQMKSLKMLCKDLDQKFNIGEQNIRGHRDYAKKSCPGTRFTDEMLSTLLNNEKPMKTEYKERTVMEAVEQIGFIQQELGDCVPTSIMTCALLRAYIQHGIVLQPDPLFDDKVRVLLNRDPNSVMGLDPMYVKQVMQEKNATLDIDCGEYVLRLSHQSLRPLKRDIEVYKQSLDRGCPFIVSMSYSKASNDYIMLSDKQLNPPVKHNATVVYIGETHSTWLDNTNRTSYWDNDDGLKNMDNGFLKLKGTLARDGVSKVMAIFPTLIKK